MSFANRRTRKTKYVVSILGCLLVCSVACAADNPAPSGSAPAAPAASSIVDDFHRLIANHQLTELRTTYNSSYGASLLFQPDVLNYYVALFHGKDFWRVIRTDSYDEAENIYHTFVSQTEELAKVDIDTLRLQANKQYTDHLVQMNQQRLQNLERDAEYQRQQTQQVAAQQQQAAQQSTSLTADLHASNNELDTVRERIRALEEQESNPTLTLPRQEAPAPATAPANSLGSAPAAQTASNP
ncbi:DUF2968 domain-containing protein [Dyella mobilis]|uniref:DUF2968 domain-containing protein n=1 Tax=Dyella mobilis TaxID=1849582 RepID=A0ABS2KB88_9GAMM|nr:DUF2968 domain-containing protein [Dyella mobilis]MBM7128445.1 DUF2968 domain-containing protein [Dyella mobilis]GLQ99751.1 hypothetical protein GCM10007863_41710 [Dyella mobilis]